MPEYGCFLACEEFRPAELVEQARMAEQAGFQSLWISDHYHPWNDAQGETCAVMTNGRFRLGVGSGEALNEHILGHVWPPASVRLEMLEKAILITRRPFNGEEISHYGSHYRVELVTQFCKGGGHAKPVMGTVCGDDVDEHVAELNAFAEAGFDRVHVSQIGPDQRGFFDFYRTKVLPQLQP
ncbi:LLM class flavin-dependent oxidoreductase [Streptomyces sp. NPDC057623]|uniref:LLM class flavin-dependent oxidoreductase n=1 Tax=Streptomyces sp. NPDC057623 TaxID=3346187 RepID=UPI0036A56998